MGLPGTAVAAAFAGALAAGALAAGALAAGALAAGALAAGALAAGADVGAGAEVAEDPQANSRATNSKTMALGRYLPICNPSRDIGILDSPLIHSVIVISAILSKISCN